MLSCRHDADAIRACCRAYRYADIVYFCCFFATDMLYVAYATLCRFDAAALMLQLLFTTIQHFLLP